MLHVVDLWPFPHTQAVRTTGPPCRRSSPSARVSTTTSPWTFPSSSKRPSRSCTTSGCVSESRTTQYCRHEKDSTHNFTAALHWESPVCSLSVLPSSRRHTFRQHVWLPGLVLRGRVSRCWLWPRHAVVPAVYPLFLHLLVQTTVRGLQVSWNIAGRAGAILEKN